MTFMIQRSDGKYFAGRVEYEHDTGFAWADLENAVQFDDHYQAVTEARTILHAAMEVDLAVPEAIPRDPDFDLEVVEVD